MGVDLREMGVDLRLCAVKGVMNSKEEFVMRLEEERGKIEAFRRELPLSMRLVADVIDLLKDELKKSKDRRCSDEKEAMSVKPDDDGTSDKMNWMSTAQLWVDPSDNSSESTEDEKDETRSHRSVFMPELKFDKKAASILPDLMLHCPSPRISDFGGAHPGSGCVPAPTPLFGVNIALQPQEQQQQQLMRKARRCWSPELHEKFIAALRQLGGAQAATPKQIRELMKVDGLTNDEVKSHLQKYRLHHRRSPTSSPVLNQPVVLVGGMWHSQEHSSSHSGSPQSPLHRVDRMEDEDRKSSECYSWK